MTPIPFTRMHGYYVMIGSVTKKIHIVDANLYGTLPNLNYVFFESATFIARRLSDMTEEEFKEFATEHLLCDGEKMAFEIGKYQWRAVSYNPADPETVLLDTDEERINEVEESSSEGVIMVHSDKTISNGWIVYEEKYQEAGLTTTAEWIHFLMSRGFWLWGDEHFENGKVIDAKTLEVNPYLK